MSQLNLQDLIGTSIATKGQAFVLFCYIGIKNPTLLWPDSFIMISNHCI